MSITSLYGENIATKSAIIIGALVLLIMVAFVLMFKWLGLVGALSMLLFIMGETFMLIAVPGIALSMGGVVGIILSTIITAFGCAYLLNNIKSEVCNSNKTVIAAVRKGFKDALVPTINAGVVMAIISVLLVVFTSGLVKGFAITFGIGVGVGLISTLLFTRMFSSLLLELPFDKENFFNLKRVVK
jgi:preprotein translocase subunit SecD